MYKNILAGLVVGFALTPLAIPSNAEAQLKSEVGRYVAVAPPAAGEKTYANFLWVLDTTTGTVTAHRIASVKTDAGEHDCFITESLLNELGYANLQEIKKAKRLFP